MCLVALPGHNVSAQVAGDESLLERGTVSYLVETWAPRWNRLSEAESQPGSASSLRLRASVDLLSLRSSLSQYVSGLDFTGRQPVGGPFGLRVSGSTGSSRTTTKQRILIETPRSEAAALGADISVRDPLLATVRGLALVGWDGGPGGLAQVSADGTGHSLSITAWTTTARESRVLLSADSLRDVGEAHEARGTEVRARIAFPIGLLTLRPTGSWRMEQLEGAPSESDAFLTASLEGATTATTIALEAGDDRHSLELAYRSRDVDLASTILKSSQSAGRLSYVRFAFTAWSLEARIRSEDRQWSSSFGHEQLEGELAARVDTWPFISLWEGLSVQAYRLNGQLQGKAMSWRLRNDPVVADSWSWGVCFGRYVVRADQDSWFVTSFGFGRTNRETVARGANAAYVVGGELARAFNSQGGNFALQLSGGVPVYVRLVNGTANQGGLAGYARASLSWSW